MNAIQNTTANTVFTSFPISTVEVAQKKLVSFCGVQTKGFVDFFQQEQIH
jgi:hypothetical protein